MTREDVDRLVSSGEWEEGLLVDFKVKVELNADFYRDVTAFANSSGGEIVVGVEEAGGIATVIHGIEVPDRDKFILPILQGIQASIKPRLLGVSIEIIDGFPNGRSVAIIKVPKSRMAPHVPNANGETSFSVRHGRYNPRMSIEELRTAFLSRDSLADWLEKSISDRLKIHSEGRELANIDPNSPRWIVHLVGAGTFEQLVSIGWEQFKPYQDLLRPLIPGVHGGAYVSAMVDGYTRVAPYNTYNSGMVLLTRDGRLEVVNAQAFRTSQPNQPADMLATQRAIVDTAKWASTSIELLRALEVAPPYYLTVSMAKCAGARLEETQFKDHDDIRFFGRTPIRMPVIELPGTPQTPQEIVTGMRPIIEFLYQVGGSVSSRWFDEDGNLIHPLT